MNHKQKVLFTRKNNASIFLFHQEDLRAEMDATAGEDEDEAKTWTDYVMQLGVYRNCKLLAKGAMGAAFNVTRKNDFTPRALKIALPDNSANDDFLKEARMIKVFKSNQYHIHQFTSSPHAPVQHNPQGDEDHVQATTSTFSSNFSRWKIL